MPRMYNPLELRKIKALEARKKQPDVIALKEQIADLHRQVKGLLDPFIKDLARMPLFVRTEFISLDNNYYVSWDLKALREDGTVDQHHRCVKLYRDSDNKVYRSQIDFLGVQSMGSNMDLAIQQTRQVLADGGWVFVGAEYDGDEDRVKITDWRELA